MSAPTNTFYQGMLPPELQKRSFASMFLEVYPSGTAPLFALTSTSDKSMATASTHGYFSITMQFPAGTFTAAYLATDTTMILTSVAGLVPGAVLQVVRTSENMRVASVNAATNTVTVERGFGRIAATTLTTSDRWFCAGNAHKEGSDRPDPVNVIPQHVINYTQIWRNAWAVTGTAKASLSEMGYKHFSESKRHCGINHARDIEYSILFGQAKMAMEGNLPIHTTQGIIDAIKQYAPGNAQLAGATTTEEQFNDLISVAWKYSTNLGDPRPRVAYCDAKAMKFMQKLGKLSGQVQMNMDQSYFGMAFKRYNHYKGYLLFDEHPLLNAGMGGQEGIMVIVDVPALKMAYMTGRETHEELFSLDSNSNSPGTDAEGGGLLTEAAVELINPNGCAVIRGLTEAV